AEAGGDHLPRFGMLAHVARQRKQCQRPLMVDRFGRPALGEAGALGLLAFATLDIGAEPARTQRDLLSRIGVLAKHLGAVLDCAVLAVAVAFRAELASIAAFGVIGATDEGSILAQL